MRTRETPKFEATPENIQRIIDLNDGLYKRFRMVSIFTSEHHQLRI